MKKILIIALLFVGCEEATNPLEDDCADVVGGAAYLDNCNVCDNDPSNDCVQDCAYVWGGDAVEDECGVCEGEGSSCLIGSWKSTEVHMTSNSEGTIHLSNENEYYLYSFNSDGTVNFISSQLEISFCPEEVLDCNSEEVIISSSTGIWIKNNNQIIYTGQNENGEQYTSIWFCTLNENILILSNIENYEHGITNGMYLILEKE